MADNLLVNGNTIATDDRGGVHFQAYTSAGSSAAATGTITATTSMTTIRLAANARRRSVLIINTGTTELRVHPASGFGGAITNGFPLPEGSGGSFEYTGALYIAVATGTGSAHYWEDSDG